jgi:hypothetical protein
MSNELSDPNQRIARLMGWTENRYNTFYWTNSETKQVIPKVDLPDYFSPDLPIGERLKMWEKLTEAQQDALIDAVIGNSFMRQASRKLLKLDQPTFAKTFLRVVEGKG